ncbi:MAG: hypothetical protein VYA22_02415 [Pseudomonadota bacterium]|nr:hypothetical protein [Pseudomonadota bacterium]
MKKKQNSLIILLIVFSLPFIISYYFLKTQNNEEQLKTTNYGTFIEPFVSIKQFNIKLFNNQILEKSNLKNKWSLIYVTNTQCLEECSNNIYLLRQVHIALGKDIYRVQRIFLTNYNEEITFFDNLAKKYPRLLFSNVTPNYLHEILFKISKKENQIYLIDPGGNVILSYESNFEGRKLMKDLKKLLKFSKQK